jgi:FkbM family methyltransferase
MIKKILLKAFKRAGYFVQKKEYMSYGIEHALDVKRLSKNSLHDIKFIFDVGANIGKIAQYYAEYFPCAEIYSFEPIKGTFAELQINTKQNPNIRSYQFAFGSEVGTTNVELQKSPLWNSLRNTNPYPLGITETVQVKTIDSFLQMESIPNIDLLKIDTEGYEIEVLKGATNFLRATKNCYIYVETTFSKEDREHTFFLDIFEYLYDLGFRFVGIYDHDYNSFAPAKPPLNYCNALFYKGDVI